ncbi:MAG: TraR/DksA C4-type zinc finger protein [Verrucomicrobiales bacterium]|jgi:DnaK suppressor protein|nr:TraR/DksA C4-type zinc finger protein [Verrucomicrobiales bacterium]
MLTADQLIDLEELIIEELDRLRAESEKTKAERAAISPDVSIGRLSRLDAMQMQEVAKEADRRREERVGRLELALEQLDAGTYGRCEGCGEDIEFDRLRTSPEATRCSDCAN